MSLAQQALQSPVWPPQVLSQATGTQFFARSTVYAFTDGSELTVNMYSPSHATGEAK